MELEEVLWFNKEQKQQLQLLFANEKIECLYQTLSQQQEDFLFVAMSDHCIYQFQIIQTKTTLQESQIYLLFLDKVNLKQRTQESDKQGTLIMKPFLKLLKKDTFKSNPSSTTPSSHPSFHNKKKINLSIYQPSTSSTTNSSPIFHSMAMDEKNGILFVWYQSHLECLFFKDNPFSSCLCIRIKESKELSTFCLDEKLKRHKLSIIVKKKLLILEYLPTLDFSYRIINEHTLPESCHTMVMIQDSIMLGFKKYYSLLSNASHPTSHTWTTVLELDTNSTTTTCVALMDQEAILKTNHVSVFLNMKDGQPSNRNPIAWSQPPCQVVPCFPYIIAQLAQKIEIYNLFDQMLVETLQFPLFKSNTNQLSHQIADQSSGIAKRGIFIFQSANMPNTISMIQPIALERQISSLIKKCRCREAFELFEKTFDNSNQAEKETKLQQMYLESGYAMMLNSETDSFYAQEAFQEYFEKCSFATLDCSQLLNYFFCKEGLEELLLSSIFAKNIKAKRANQNIKSHEDGSLNLILFEKQAQEQFKLVKYTFLRQFFERRRILYIQFLSTIMMDSKNKVQSRIHEQLVHIDTALLKMYVDMECNKIMTTNNCNPLELLEKLLKDKYCFCELNESQKILIAQGKEFAIYLAMLLRAKSKHREALVTFEQVYQLFSNDDKSKRDKIVREAIDTFGTIEDPVEAEWCIAQYGKWIINTKHKQVIRMFKRNQFKLEPLKPETIFSFFQTEYGSELTSNKYFVHLLLQYLEHIVVELKMEDPKYHTELALQYIDLSQQGEEEMISKLLVHLSKSNVYHLEKVSQRLADTNLYLAKVIVCKKLNQHQEALKILIFDLNDLQSAEEYCCSSTSKQQQQQQEEQEEEEELNPNQILDSNGMQVQNYMGQPQSSILLCLLLQLCFSASDRTDLYQFGIYILNKHATKIDLIAALQVIPPSLPLHQIQSFLINSVDETNQMAHSTTMSVKLSNAVLLQTMSTKTIFSKKRVLINDRSICRVCGKRIHVQQVFAVFPDLSVFHYSCMNSINKNLSRHIHPISKKNFKVQPLDLD